MAELFSYEGMKCFLVLFSFETILVLIAVSFIYDIYNFVRWIIKHVRKHRERKAAQISEETQFESEQA